MQNLLQGSTYYVPLIIPVFCLQGTFEPPELPLLLPHSYAPPIPRSVGPHTDARDCMRAVRSSIKDGDWLM